MIVRFVKEKNGTLIVCKQDIIFTIFNGFTFLRENPKRVNKWK